MKLKGCTFDTVGTCLSASGKGGGGGPTSAGFGVMAVADVADVSLTVTVTCGFSLSKVVIFSSDFVLCNFAFVVLLAAMLRKYSDGFINEFESLSAFGNFGGMNGNTNCLLTKCGPAGAALVDDSCAGVAGGADSTLAVVTTTVDLSLSVPNKTKAKLQHKIFT